jgi:hypothetical protein
MIKRLAREGRIEMAANTMKSRCAVGTRANGALVGDARHVPRAWRSANQWMSRAMRSRLLDVIVRDVGVDVERIVRAGRRIPEEVLGPMELRNAWTGVGVS